MTQLLRIETQMGRNREGQTEETRFGPRVIDLDMLLFGDKEQYTELLVLPHPRMRQRAFVLVPLQDIFPELTFPDGKTLIDALKSLSFHVDGDKIWQ